MFRSGSGLVFVVLLGLGLATPAMATQVFTSAPENPNPDEKYLFFLHGISVEQHGPDSWNGTFNRTYEFTKISKHLADRGFNVIAEVRPKGTVPLRYAIGVVKEIDRLLAAGVPGKNISVVSLFTS